MNAEEEDSSSSEGDSSSFYDSDESSDGESDTDFVDFVNIIEDPSSRKGFDPMAVRPKSNIESRNWKLDETNRRELVLSEESIDAVMRTQKCPPIRKSASCKHGNCLDKLGFVSISRACVIKLRSEFYPKEGNVTARRGTLLNKLKENLIIGDDKLPHIQYQIQCTQSKIEVCKGFYRMASGIPIKMFDECVSCVEGTTKNHRIVNCCNK